MKSLVDSNLSFNDKVWCVSLINTGGVLVGSHAKIVVEGLKPGDAGFHSATLFVAEYHIFEMGEPGKFMDMVPVEMRPSLESALAVTQPLTNTKGKYMVLVKEEEDYNDRQREQYAKASSKSWRVSRPAALDMITAIKEEQEQILKGKLSPNFQYAGYWCFYSFNYGHNCTTWAEEKLAIANIGSGQKLLDSLKAMPSYHVK